MTFGLTLRTSNAEIAVTGLMFAGGQTILRRLLKVDSVIV